MKTKSFSSFSKLLKIQVHQEHKLTEISSCGVAVESSKSLTDKSHLLFYMKV